MENGDTYRSRWTSPPREDPRADDAREDVLGPEADPIGEQPLAEQPLAESPMAETPDPDPGAQDRSREDPMLGQGTRGRGGGKDSYTIGEVVERLRPEFPTLSVSKIRYLERRRLINLTRTRGGYRLFSGQDIELLKYILTLQDKEYLPLKVIKKRIEGGGGFPAGGGDAAGDLSRVLEDRTYTREELADTLETDSRFVDELVTVGVIGRSGELTQRDAEIARLAQEMAKYSIQPRHLRGIMAAVDREAALFKQVVNPELRSRDDGRVAEAMNKARHLASVDSRMKELMMANVIDTFAP
ncbi:transcriptional regulator FtsR [Rubrobacter tropicus]|uniref:transcriptional regulator FtsR n=1 Tax=Rubrobacter tropicus TaxID=2653851 RepID=UPI0014097758|nr:MerR family transcriptional regulator [Rubrobacter tropicus]